MPKQNKWSKVLYKEYIWLIALSPPPGSRQWQQTSSDTARSFIIYWQSQYGRAEITTATTGR